LNFCKMEIRLTLGRKNLLRDFSSRERKRWVYWCLSPVFKEITPTISLKNISLISILHERGPAAIDVEDLSRDEVARVRGEQDGRTDEILGPAPSAQRGLAEHPFVEIRVGLQGSGQLGRDVARTDRVDVDIVPGPLNRQRLGQAEQ